MNIVHIFGAMDIGGAEMRTLDLQRALRPRGVRFTYLTLSGRRGNLADDFESAGAAVIPMPVADIRFPLRLWKYLRRSKPTAVDSHVATFSGLILLIAWAAGTPIRIAHFRSDGDSHGDSIRRRFQRRMMRLLIKGFATDIIGVSPSALTLGYRDNWQSDSRARVIANGLPLFEAEQGEATVRKSLNIGTARLLLHVGRPSPEKDRPLAVRCLAAVRQNGVDAHLVLIGGSGPDTEAVYEQVDQHGLRPYVHDLGQQRNARAYMLEADALLLTSNREGLPGVVLEALSVGTPVVASPLPGVSYIAERVEGVEVVVDRDDLDCWCEGVGRVLGHRSEMDHRGRVRDSFRSSPFSIERAADEHFNLYGGEARA